MKVCKLNGSLDRLVTITINKYKIDWQNDGASKIERQFRDLIYPFWKNKIILYQPRIPGSLLRLDFLNVTNRLSVEIDGSQHNEFNRHFHNNSRMNYLSSIKRDLDKDKWCEQNKIKMIHLISEDLDNFSPSYIFNKFAINII